jgi:hypothetical protein
LSVWRLLLLEREREQRGEERREQRGEESREKKK